MPTLLYYKAKETGVIEAFSPLISDTGSSAFWDSFQSLTEKLHNTPAKGHPEEISVQEPTYLWSKSGRSQPHTYYRDRGHSI